MGFMITPNPFSFLGACLFNFEVKIYSNLSYESPQSINASLSLSSKDCGEKLLKSLWFQSFDSVF